MLDVVLNDWVNRDRRRRAICKFAARSTGQSGKNKYLETLANAYNQGVSGFFTDD
jgi:hypothetical protein